MARINKSDLKTGKRILLIDDQEDYRVSTSSLLEREGHEVVMAASGEEAIDLIKNEYFDLVLLDYYMPGGMNGEETVKKIRLNNKDLQIILQTGYSGENPPREMLKCLDIQGYHDKSDGPDKLLMWVDIGIKSAFTIQHINKSRQGLHYILNITPELHKFQLLQDLLQGILLQISGLLGIMNSFIALFPNSSKKDISHGFLAFIEDTELQIKASTGKFSVTDIIDKNTGNMDFEKIIDALKNKKIKINSSSIIIPLSVGDETMGVIYLEESVLLKEDLELLNIFANQAAVAIQNAKLYEMATFDPLTGIYVRRFFNQCLIRELRSALRSNQNITLIMLDLNDLKTINDTYGHIAGDQTLSLIGKILRQATRSSDFPCRYGGDEFAILLTDTSIEKSKIIIKRILELLENKFIGDGDNKLPIKISIGVSGLSKPEINKNNLPYPIPNVYFDETAKEIITKADEMLYVSKKDQSSPVHFQPEIPWASINNLN